METASPQPAEETSARSRKAPRRQFRRIEILTTILTAVTAVVALILSVITTVQLNRRADIFLTMPKIIRISQGIPALGVTAGTSQLSIWIQPTLMVYQKTDVASVVTSARLNVTPSPVTKSALSSSVLPYLYWLEVDKFVYNQNTGLADPVYDSDPSPIVVAQDKPQAMHLRFFAAQPFLTPGRWQAVLTVERQGQSTLMRNFCIDISENNISRFSTSAYITYRNDQAKQQQTSSSTTGCYHSP